MSRKTWTCLILFLLPAVCLLGQDKEYLIKAVWLEKFSRYVTWPQESHMADTSTPFVLAVIGDTPFTKILEKVYGSGRKINKKEVKLVCLSSPEELKSLEECHLLFISPKVSRHLPVILAYLKNKPILTVGDTKGFARKGVHINFYYSGKQLRFEINPFIMRDHLLFIDPSFLASGKIVRTGERKR